MELADWTVAYVRSRDAITRTLVSHERQGDEITFSHKHKIHHFLLSPELQVPEDVRDRYTVVCLNTEENIARLLAEWDRFLQPHLTVLFVNPDANAFWHINPLMHHKVSDEKKREKGVRAIAQDTPIVE